MTLGRFLKTINPKTFLSLIKIIYENNAGETKTILYTKLDRLEDSAIGSNEGLLGAEIKTMWFDNTEEYWPNLIIKLRNNPLATPFDEWWDGLKPETKQKIMEDKIQEAVEIIFKHK